MECKDFNEFRGAMQAAALAAGYPAGASEKQAAYLARLEWDLGARQREVGTLTKRDASARIDMARQGGFRAAASRQTMED